MRMQITPRLAAAFGAGLVALLAMVALLAIAPWSGDTVADTGIQGDTDCSGGVNAVDALWPLRLMADAPPIPECIGAGDIDCGGSIDEADVTAILRFAVTGENTVPQGAGCPAIGEPLTSGSPAPTPLEDAYSLTPLISANYLGEAAEPMIKYVPITGRPNEALAVLQSGLIYRVAVDESFAPDPWGDVSDLLAFGGEEGLLSLAFSPEYETDSRVYMYYTIGCPSPSTCNPTVLARFTGTPDGLQENTHQTILEIPDIRENHNGGDIAFDSNGYLYLSLGDGGGSGDPSDAGQDLTSLRGKVLRLDVSGENGYAIPPGNPFAGGTGGNKDEIFAYGFRNPFRMTVDPVTDDVWLGDVGQDNWEEVDRVDIGGNYGWDCYEADAEFEIDDQCAAASTMEFPRAAYAHGQGQAVTGGVIYRGDDMPELYGWYLYADFYSGRIWAVDTESNDPPVQLMESAYNIPAFTLLPDGEVAVVTYDSGVFRLTD